MLALSACGKDGATAPNSGEQIRRADASGTSERTVSKQELKDDAAKPQASTETSPQKPLANALASKPTVMPILPKVDSGSPSVSGAGNSKTEEHLPPIQSASQPSNIEESEKISPEEKRINSNIIFSTPENSELRTAMIGASKHLLKRRYKSDFSDIVKFDSITCTISKTHPENADRCDYELGDVYYHTLGQKQSTIGKSARRLNAALIQKFGEKAILKSSQTADTQTNTFLSTKCMREYIADQPENRKAPVSYTSYVEGCSQWLDEPINYLGWSLVGGEPRNVTKNESLFFAAIQYANSKASTKTCSATGRITPLYSAQSGVDVDRVELNCSGAIIGVRSVLAKIGDSGLAFVLVDMSME